MGALTSKSYSFLARRWEVDPIESCDYFDSYGTLILFEKRDFEILRIIPRKMMQNLWISDKIRFFFDGLKYQRLMTPILYNYKILKYFSISWDIYYFYIKSFFLVFSNKKKNLNNFFFISDDLIDLFDLISIKTFMYSLSDFINLNNYNFMYYKEFDFLSEFLVNSEKFVLNNIIILFGCDLRLELPNLYLVLKENIKLSKLKVYIFGFISISNLKIECLGFTMIELFTFSLFRLLKLKNYIHSQIGIIFGSLFINNINFSLVYNNLKSLFYKLFKQYNLNFSINIIYNTIGDLNKLFSGFVVESKDIFLYNIKNKIKIKTFNYNLNFFIFINKLLILNNYLFNINNLTLILFYGSHIEFSYKDVVNFKLPLVFIYEKDNYIYTILGKTYLNSYIYFPAIVNNLQVIFVLNKMLQSWFIKINVLVVKIKIMYFKNKFFVNNYYLKFKYSLKYNFILYKNLSGNIINLCKLNNIKFLVLYNIQLNNFLYSYYDSNLLLIKASPTLTLLRSRIKMSMYV